jgi:CubicO group peptidase (beta-lactamase class C family)
MPSFDPMALDALLKQYTDPTAPLGARVPGWAFVVRSKDTVLYRKGAGNLEPSTPGWMASVSKLVTPILALKAVESGLITLDTPLQPLIPDVDLSRVLTGFSAEGTPQYESARAPVTLSNAMMHTSGCVTQVNVESPNTRHARLSYTFVNEALLRLHGMTPMSALRDGLKTSNRTIFGPLVAQPDAAWNY